jgi:hypothetical protein
MTSKVKSLAMHGAICVGIGIAAFALTFASGFGPCGPGTTFGEFLLWLGFITTFGGACMMIGAILEAAFGRSKNG